MKKCLNRKGLSLVEVVMSALVLTIMLGGIYAVYINAHNMIVLAFHKTVAIHWAQSGIECRRAGIPYQTQLNVLTEGKGGLRTDPPVVVALSNALEMHTEIITWTE